MPRPIVATIALGIAAFLFGATFVVVKDAVTILPPLGFVGWRFLLGAVALLSVSRPKTPEAVRAGVIAGTLLFAGYAFQTKGLVTATASNSGLITGLYVVLTPLLAAAVGRRRPRLRVLMGAAVAFAGLSLLTIGDGLHLEAGDAWTLGAAVSFAAHIVYLGRVAHRHRVVALTGVQLAVCGVLGLIGSLALEDFATPGRDVLAALLVTGLVVSAGAFLLQVWSQTILGPSRTALVLALEPAFAALTGAVVLDEQLGLRGGVGAGLILLGIYVVLAGTGPEDELEPTAVSPPR